MDTVFLENLFISDHLDQKGARASDILELYPLCGKKKDLKLNYQSLEFVDEKSIKGKDFLWIRALPSLEGERFHIEIKKVKTKGRNSATKERIVCRSLNQVPFQINGVFSLYSILERGDELRIGHNKIVISEAQIQQIDDEKIALPAIKSNLSVLIQGETGTGKTRLAKEIHEKSGLKGNFVHLNLTSYSENLLESELFGHKKGAFTGANEDKIGAIEAAKFGTLFLDEIDSISIELQTKLLLFLDNKNFRKVGCVEEKYSNARIILATGRNLKNMVERGEMRKDFYFRLTAGHFVKLKPLRDETCEIEKFCHLISLENNFYLSPKLLEFYKTYPWPGNYRQLKNHLLKKKVFLKGRKMEFDSHDDALLVSSSDLVSLECHNERIMTMKEIKIIHAKTVYAKLQHNLSTAAKALRVSPKSLRLLVA